MRRYRLGFREEVDSVWYRLSLFIDPVVQVRKLSNQPPPSPFQPVRLASSPYIAIHQSSSISLSFLSDLVLGVFNTSLPFSKQLSGFRSTTLRVRYYSLFPRFWLSLIIFKVFFGEYSNFNLINNNNAY